MATTKTQLIATVGTVFVPVSDQDAALAFYRDKLGFELRADDTFGEDNRWIEVAPAGAQTVVALVPPMGDGPKPGGDVGFGYDTDDLEAAVTELTARGVEFEEILRMPAPVPPMAYFRDLDGNRMLLVQRAG
jgi:catechol 2,3-dioxygenase-like lactoylglutathione lyase family enzyme